MVVVGKHEADGWRVSILRDGEKPLVLDAAAARQLARDLSDMADICDGRWNDETAD